MSNYERAQAEHCCTEADCEYCTGIAKLLDDAEQRGAERMRERAAEACRATGAAIYDASTTARKALDLAADIVAGLPLTEEEPNG